MAERINVMVSIVATASYRGVESSTRLAPTKPAADAASNELGRPLFSHSSPIYIELAGQRIFKHTVAEPESLHHAMTPEGIAPGEDRCIRDCTLDRSAFGVAVGALLGVAVWQGLFLFLRTASTMLSLSYAVFKKFSLANKNAQ